jgi:hypothetical protein
MKSQFQIKGLKTWATRDGGGYQYNLYRDNKKVAFIHEEGNGGPLKTEWFDKKTEAELNTYVKSLGQVQCGDFAVDMDIAIWLEELLNDAEFQKKLSKYRKQGTLFRFLTDPVDSFRTMKTLDVAKAVEYLDKKYPNQYVLV